MPEAENTKCTLKREIPRGHVSSVSKAGEEEAEETATLTLDEPIASGTPAGADAEVADPERLRVGVGHERGRFALLAHGDVAVVPPADFKSSQVSNSRSLWVRVCCTS